MNHQLLDWLRGLPSQELQQISTETNKILLARYQQEANDKSEYSANLASILVTMGDRQTKGNRKFIVQKLKECNNVYYSFDKLIKKLENKECTH